ncbi:hypothetical protein [Streptomyces sp. NPDC048643]|uniref:VMAP-C domain-containing protein n=1 Tax=Streptomyces sp. NPDC048643 TaxID=3155637 RepID=UPI00343AC207
MGASEVSWLVRAYWDAAAPKALEKAMVEVLRSAPSLAGAPARRALARMLAHALNRTFSSDESATQPAEDHLSFIVARCMAQGEPAEATDALARAVGTVTGDADVTTQLRLLADWQLARTRLGNEDLGELRSLLQGLGDVDARSIARACLHPFPVHLPAHCTDPWSVVLYLLRRNALPNGLPLFLVFLEHLAPAVDVSLRERLHGWAEKHAGQQGLYEQLAECRSRIAAAPVEHGESRESRVMFVLLPDGLDDDYCILRVWHQDGQNGRVPLLRDGDSRVHRHDLEPLVHERLQQTLTHIAQPVALTVEFWLPVDLANLPVTQWCRPGPDPVWRSPYQVVVRSLDRPQASRTSWELWWDRMISSRPCENEAAPAAEQPSPLRNAPASSQLLVLDTPPDKKEGRRQLLEGIRSGAPAILWHRSDCSSDAFRQSVQHLVEKGSLADLPARLRQLQQSTSSLGTPSLTDLTLLWDDPTQPLPVLKNLTSPDEVASR